MKGITHDMPYFNLLLIIERACQQNFSFAWLRDAVDPIPALGTSSLTLKRPASLSRTGTCSTGTLEDTQQPPLTRCSLAMTVTTASLGTLQEPSHAQLSCPPLESHHWHALAAANKEEHHGGDHGSSHSLPYWRMFPLLQLAFWTSEWKLSWQ